jgi:carbonic anhydrase
MSAPEALERLREGNRRFINLRHDPNARHYRPELVDGQNPFAVIVGCSDSRTPAEIVFDQGLGDLFVIRLAGNIVAPSVVGSVEFAASAFNTQLVVVMGHTRCGAVNGALVDLEHGRAPASRNIAAITDRIRPHVEPLWRAMGTTGDRDTLMREAVRANVLASASHLRHGSALLEGLIAEGKLAVVSAVYELETGLVTIIDNPDLEPVRAAPRA